MKTPKLNRLFHRWASVVIAVPLLVVILTGVLLQLKKDVGWIQPPTQRGSTRELTLGFDRILEIARAVQEAEIEGWEDIDRLDVRPSKGMLKVRAINRWEIQVDTATGEVLQVAYRRSDLIESLHDGSFFHDKAKLWIFLPSALILLSLWGTGIYLFAQPWLARGRRNRRPGTGLPGDQPAIGSMLVPAATVLFGTVVSASAQEPGWLPLPDGPVERIAFGSCAKHWQPQPIWDAIIAKRPDLFIFLGDNIYADTDGTTAWPVSKEQLTGEWNRLADKPEFQKARAAFPFLATWDNHDYGSHAGGAEHPVKNEAKECFLTFIGEPENSPRWKRSGIYDAKILGPEGKRLQIILLDTKFNRSAFKKDPTPKEERLKAGKVGGYLPDPDREKTHLGDEQWAWLEAQLKEPADLRLICSSTQVIPDQKGMDEWGNFPRERRRLIELAEQSGNAIILSGNVHFAEISRLGGEDGLVEFTSSGMTHVNDVYGTAPNRYRVGEPLVELNFGLVEIDWASGEVRLSACNADGQAALDNTVKLSEPPPVFR